MKKSLEEIFEEVTGLDELIEMIVTQSSIYICQNRRIFEAEAQEMKAFLGISDIMVVTKLPIIAEYWGVDTFIRNSWIQNTMNPNLFVQILQKLHFAYSTQDDKTDRAFKIGKLIDHFSRNSFKQ